jgi:hypothetical protein
LDGEIIDTLKRARNERVVPHWRDPLGTLMENPRKNRNSVSMTGVPVENRTERLPNTI